MVMVSNFQSRVYAQLNKIPRGSVTTYKALADSIGCGSPRAIGQALARNPFAPEVPCHRVVQSDLRVGGFKGTRQSEVVASKLALLRSEGVVIREGKVASNTPIFRF